MYYCYIIYLGGSIYKVSKKEVDILKRKFLIAILAANMVIASSFSYVSQVYASQPTAASTVSPADSEGKQTDIQLDFSSPGGFYREDFKLELKSNNTNAKIYYTLDGSDPNSNSLVYTSPIDIKKGNVDKNTGLSYIPTTPLEAPTGVGLEGWKWKVPIGNISKAVVVKAIAITDDSKKSDIITQTYWVDEAGKKYTLPVVSIVTDKANFFDDKTGLYVPGDTYKNDNGWDKSLWGNGNYKLDGDEWVKPIHIEFYSEKGDCVFSQNADTKIKGTASASLPQKSLKVYLDKYGNNGANSSLFSDVKDITGKDINNYRRVILRNAGQGFLFTYFEDALTQKLSKELGIDTEGYKPVIVFIDGEYWGIQNLRENYDKYYLQEHYGANPKKVDMIKSEPTEPDGLTADEGDKDAYNSMTAFIKSSDMKDTQNYEKANTVIDIDNYISYIVAEVYCENSDWPENNVEFWRSKNDYNPSASDGLDGRWRWMLHDTDNGFGYTGVYDHDSMKEAKKDEIFAKLIENENFKNGFINRMADALNTTYKPEKVLKTIDDMQSVIEPEMQQHIDRWSYPAPTVEGWNKNVDIMKKFATVRPDNVRKSFIEDFKLNGQVAVNITLPDTLKGTIQINSLTQDKLAATSTSSTWQGTYFKDVPITLKAVPKKGYVFSHWEGIDSETDKNKQSISVILKDDISLKPIFLKVDDRVINNPGNGERTIKFTKTVDASTVNDKNIYVTTDEEGSNIVQGISISVDKDNPYCVKVIPSQDGWKQGQTYYIFIKPEVKSSEKTLLNKIIRCKFTIN